MDESVDNANISEGPIRQQYCGEIKFPIFELREHHSDPKASAEVPISNTPEIHPKDFSEPICTPK